jgi:hypothetical protein
MDFCEDTDKISLTSVSTDEKQLQPLPVPNKRERFYSVQSDFSAGLAMGPQGLNENSLPLLRKNSSEVFLHKF